MYLPTYVCTYLCTYLRMYLPTYVPTYLRMYLPTYVCTYLRMYLPMYVRIIPIFFWNNTYYIVFTFTGSVRNVRNDANIHIYICIYIYMSTTWRTRSRYKIFRLYFGEIHLLAPDFISEGNLDQKSSSKYYFSQ